MPAKIQAANLQARTQNNRRGVLANLTGLATLPTANPANSPSLVAQGKPHKGQGYGQQHSNRGKSAWPGGQKGELKWPRFLESCLDLQLELYWGFC